MTSSLSYESLPLSRRSKVLFHEQFSYFRLVRERNTAFVGE